MRTLAPLLILGLLAVGCGDDGSTSPAPTTLPSTVASTTLPPTVASTTLPPTTSPPTTAPTTSTAPTCDPTALYAEIDAVLALARLEPSGGWTTDATGPFADRTNSGDEFAGRLALDCGVVVADTGGDRLLIGAWTGSRLAYVVQDAAPPATPFTTFSRITILTEEPFGEYLRPDNSVWAGTLEGGESLVIGHVDYNAGAAAKAWQVAVPSPPDGEPTLESERHAIATLRAAGGRNVAIAQPASFGSVEGIVQLISPTGQILLVDAAPLGTFDPSTPRYLDGETTTETVEGVEIRLTAAEPSDHYSVPTEIGLTCGDHVWIFEPPINGTGEEMLAFARLVIESGVCRTG